MTTTSAGRIGLAHPDLGTPGGSTLWDAIHAIYTKLGNSASIQWFGPYTITASGTQVIAHNFDMNLADLSVYLIESDVVLTMEQQAKFGIAETSGSEKNSITITNNDSVSRTIDLYVMGFNLDKLMGLEKVRYVTSNATPTTIKTIAIPTGEAMALEIMCVARYSTTANVYKITALAENNSGTVTVSIVEKTQQEDTAGYDVTCVVNSTNVDIQVTGEAQTVEWYLLAQKTYF